MSRLIAFSIICAALLSAEPNLAIESMGLHQFEDGPLLPTGYELVPGEDAHFSCRLTGYQAEKKNEDQRLVKLSWTAKVLDPEGVLIEPARTGRIESVLLREDKDWIPKFLVNFVVPSFALAGEYHVAIQAKDEIAGTEAHADFAFRVRGHEVEPSETLVARNFRFLSSEEDTIGTRSGLYHPGDTLWARFDLTGYKFGDNNHFSVDYGLAVENADGMQLFAQPDAFSQSGDSSYPQRYVPVTLNISLDKNVRPGMYTLIVSIRDNVGHQNWELRQTFLLQP